MIIVYDRNGRIDYTVEDPYPPELLATYQALAGKEADFNFHDEPQASIDGCYVDIAAGCLCERPDMPVEVNGLTLSAIPAGAIVDVDFGAQVAEAVSGEIELHAEDAGNYVVQLRKWPFKDFRVDLEVPA